MPSDCPYDNAPLERLSRLASPANFQPDTLLGIRGVNQDEKKKVVFIIALCQISDSLGDAARLQASSRATFAVDLESYCKIRPGTRMRPHQLLNRMATVRSTPYQL